MTNNNYQSQLANRIASNPAKYAHIDEATQKQALEIIDKVSLVATIECPLCEKHIIVDIFEEALNEWNKGLYNGFLNDDVSEMSDDEYEEYYQQIIEKILENPRFVKEIDEAHLTQGILNDLILRDPSIIAHIPYDWFSKYIVILQAS